MIEVLGEATRSLRRRGRHGVGAGECRSLGVAVGDRRPRGQPGTGDREVLVPRREVEVAQRSSDVVIVHDDDPPALPVAAARREARGIEHAGEHRVRNRLGREVANRSRRAQRVLQLHTKDPMRASARAPLPAPAVPRNGARFAGWTRTRCSPSPARSRSSRVDRADRPHGRGGARERRRDGLHLRRGRRTRAATRLPRRCRHRAAACRFRPTWPTTDGVTQLAETIAAAEPAVHIFVNNAGATWARPARVPRLGVGQGARDEREGASST